MPSEKFTKFTLNKIKGFVQKGEKQLEYWKDEDQKGLAIKITGKKASWYLKTKNFTLLIKPFEESDKDRLDEIREVAKIALSDARAGLDVTHMLKSFAAGHQIESAKAIGEVYQGTAKTWEQVRDAYLEWAYENKAKDTARGYSSSLGVGALSADFQGVAGMPVKLIKTHHLVSIRENILRRIQARDGAGTGIRQADLTVNALKACFKWYANRDGIDFTSPAAALSKSDGKAKKRSDKKEGRALTELEIGALWYELEACQNATTARILKLQLLTGQRRLTPTAALLDDISLDKDGFSVIWDFKAKGAARALPLSPEGAKIVRQALKFTREDNPHLFPQMKHRRAGSAFDGHFSERAVSKFIEEQRKNGGIFADLEFVVSTHDLRKTFGTHMANKMHLFKINGKQLAAEDVQIITHADEGKSSIFSIVYNLNNHFDVKFEILDYWEKFVFACYDKYLISIGLKKEPVEEETVQEAA